MANSMFINAAAVAENLGISRQFAYKLIREMNQELAAKGYMTIAGRVSRKYYKEKFYGMTEGVSRVGAYKDTQGV